MSAGSCTGSDDKPPVISNDSAESIPGASNNRDYIQLTITRRLLSHSVKFVQLNLQHSTTATAVLCKQISDSQDAVIFIQAPCTSSVILGLP